MSTSPTIPASSSAPATTTVATPTSAASGQNLNVDREKIYAWIIELSSPETREAALLELSKKREVVPDLAPMLWHSFGTMAALLQEIINIYPAINPPVADKLTLILSMINSLM